MVCMHCSYICQYIYRSTLSIIIPHMMYNIYTLYTHLTNLLLYTYTLMYPYAYTSYYFLSNSTLAFYGLQP